MRERDSLHSQSIAQFANLSWAWSVRMGPRDNSNKQWTFRIYRWFGSVMFNPPLPLVAEEIEAQTVAFKICELQQRGAKLHPLVVFQQAFENRILHTLTVVETGLGDPAEAPFAFGA